MKIKESFFGPNAGLKQVQTFRGVGLALILMISSIAVSTIIENKTTSDQYNYLVPSKNYSWDFSSGLTLSQSMADQQANLLYFDTSVGRIDYFSAQPIGGYGSVLEAYYIFNTGEITSSWNIRNNGWETRIYRANPPVESIDQWFWRFLSPQLPLENVSKSLTNEISMIEGLQNVNYTTSYQLYERSLDIGDLEFIITQVYGDGTIIRVTLVNHDLFIKVSHFDKYYGDDDDDPPHIVWYPSQDIPAQYYVGNLNKFFVSFTQSVNELLGYLLGV